ncbi:MAG: carbohydrate ABC transporter permease [Clostridia bacterium]|nr:carbohydrate ABC transporter permease [Clostridia bacterium]
MAASSIKKAAIRRSGTQMALRWLLRIFLYAWTITILFPMFWMIVTSLKTSFEFMNGNVWGWPQDLTFENFKTAWLDADMAKYTANTLFVVVLTLVLDFFIVTITSYVIGRYPYKWARFLEMFYFLCMMVPGALLLVPQYFQIYNLGEVLDNIIRNITGNPDFTLHLTDNLVTLGVIYSIGSLPGTTFLMVGFVKKIDKSFVEAAKIDGAREWYVFSKIVLPFVKPIVFYHVISKFMGTWNEYLTALTFLNGEEYYTISVGIQKLINKYTYQSNYGAIFAGLCISMLPILIIYIVFQKQIQNGTDMGEGLK